MSTVKNPLSVALYQMTSTGQVTENLQFILRAIETSKASFLCFPENSLFFNTTKGPIPESQGFSKESPELLEIRNKCEERGKTVHLGGIPWWDDGKIKNAAVVIGPSGYVGEIYFKTHLFDLDLPDLRVMESDSFAPGNQLQTFEVDGWVFATAICYDLRFPEIFVHYQSLGVDAFLVPSAFTAKTGKAHWETLLKARAFENQCYVLAPAQIGGHWSQDKTLERRTWGQTMAIGPWGETLGQDKSHTEFLKFNNSTEGPIELVLECEASKRVRKAMPMDQHRAFETKVELRCPEEKL